MCGERNQLGRKLARYCSNRIVKKTLVTITINYTDARIETSAGILLSALPSRSFAATSTYSAGPSPVLTSVVAAESDTRPLIVPFAAVNVRIGNDWLWPYSRRRGGIYATFLAGVNPNTTTARLRCWSVRFMAVAGNQPCGSFCPRCTLNGWNHRWRTTRYFILRHLADPAILDHGFRPGDQFQDPAHSGTLEPVS